MSAEAGRTRPVTVTTYPDGPVVVRGDFTIQGVDGQEIEHGRIVALCRCGASALKPFCDGNHKNVPTGRTNGA